jgi:tripartite-type tricarboxylate transporter receptor subunit TctC
MTLIGNANSALTLKNVRDRNGILGKLRHHGDRARFSLLVIFMIASTACPPATAERYPDKPIRLIVPFPPGGGNDILARSIGQKLTASTGQPVVIDNRGGAGGNIGAAAGAHAAPDGYTLLLGGVGSHGINPGLQAKLGYDPIRDFAPITLIASAPLIVVVNASLPVKSTAELIQYAKARPGELNFASSGTGSIAHLAPEMLDAMANIQMTHVPYKGTAPALVDLLGGQVQLMMNSAVSMLPQVRATKVRALAVTGARRLAALPDLPTVAESGVPGYHVASWYGVLAPARTSHAIIDKLNREIVSITLLPELRERLAADGAEAVGNSPAEFAAYIKSELAAWAAVIKRAGIRPE